MAVPESALEGHAAEAIGEAAKLAGPAAAIISVLAGLVPALTRVDISLDGYTADLTITTENGRVDYQLVNVGDGNLEARMRHVQVDRGVKW